MLKYLLTLTILTTMIIPLVQYKAFGEESEVYIELGSSDANSGKSFDPKTLTVSAGTTVKWENKDTAGHTVTNGKDVTDPEAGKIFDSGFPLIKPGAEWEYTFDAAGTFPYFCQVHPWMSGTIMVEGTSGGNSSPEMTAATPSGIKVTLSWTPEVIEPGKDVTFTLKFADPNGSPIDGASYDFMLIRQGTHLTHRSLQSIAQGVSTEKMVFKEDQTGSVTLRLENINLTTGENVDFSINVVPEFPTAVIVMASLFGIVTMVSFRYRKLLRARA